MAQIKEIKLEETLTIGFTREEFTDKVDIEDNIKNLKKYLEDVKNLVKNELGKGEFSIERISCSEENHDIIDIIVKKSFHMGA